MASGNLKACLVVTLAYEGGYTANRKDPGNWTGGKVGVGKLKGTKYGIAAASYPNLDIKNLTVDQACSIYAEKYWTPVRGDDLPYGIDLVTFDFGVNSGTSRSARYLQSVLGVTQDGKIGAATIKAAILADGKAVIQKLCAKRLNFLKALKTWATFGKGWGRRVADVEAKAVAMYIANGRALTPAGRTELEAEAKKAGKTAAAQNGVAGGAVATSGGAAVAEPNWLLITVVAAVVIGVAVVLVSRARHNKDRANAYAKAAAA